MTTDDNAELKNTPFTTTGERYQNVNRRPDSASTFILLDTATGDTWTYHTAGRTRDASVPSGRVADLLG